MRAQHLLSGCLIATLSLAVAARADELNKSSEAVEARMKKDIFYLASDECEGRGVTTKGINLAADYIVRSFKDAGLKPGGVGGTWFQPFPIAGSKKLGSPNAVDAEIAGKKVNLKLDEQFKVSGMSDAGKVKGELVFVGYSITAKDIGYDDYAGIDAAGKVAIVIRKTPKVEGGFDGQRQQYHAGLATKIANAERHKAVGVIIVNDRETAGEDDKLMDFSLSQFDSPARLPVVHVKRAVVDEWLVQAGKKSLAELEKEIGEGPKPQSLVLPGASADVEVTVKSTEAKNVIGYLDGSGPLANEIIVVGAHYDHLGFGGRGSMAGNLNSPTIHYGADDNGSGTTMVLELARRFASMPNRQGRKLVFMTFSGEELGLLGSAYYCNNQPLFPLADTASMVNLDMVGRLRADKETKKDKIQVWGTGSAKEFVQIIDGLNEKYQFEMKKIPGGTGPSDHDSFYRKNVPVYFFFTDYHPEYHKPSDKPELINLAGMAKVANMVEELIVKLTSMPERPQYVAMAQPKPGSQPRARGPRVGIQPEYGETKEGVLLKGVTEDTPAAKAGLKAGDRIMAIDGKPTASLESYMTLVAGYKAGDTLKMEVIRDGKKITIDLKLQ